MPASPIYRINRPRVIDESFDEEVVVINLDTGSYFSLERSAADIWKAVGQRSAVPDVVEGLTVKYSGERSDIESAVMNFLADLERENLIVSDGEKTSDGHAVTASPPGRPPFEAPALQKYTDMQELLLIDPIHEVDDSGWPRMKPKSADGK